MGTFIVYDPDTLCVISAVGNDLPHDEEMCRDACPPGLAARWTPENWECKRPEHDLLRDDGIEHVPQSVEEKAAREAEQATAQRRDEKQKRYMAWRERKLLEMYAQETGDDVSDLMPE